MDKELRGMGAIPVARYLVEFNRDRTGHAAEPEVEPIARPGKVAVVATEEAYTRGVRDGRASAKAVADASLIELRQRHAEELANTRRVWTEEEGATIERRLEDGVTRLELSIAESVGRILEPLLTDSIRHRAIEELIETLKLVLSKDEGVTFHISGPEDLLKIIQNGLDGKTVAVVYAPGEQTDVRVVAGKTFMETCLGAWMAKLREAIGT
jgi:hypothetical protein